MANHRATLAVGSPNGRIPAGLLWAAVAMLPLGALVWAYWDALVPLFSDWQRSKEYSVGQLVPLAALYLLWHEREALRKCRLSPCWWGIGLILLGQAGRAFGLLFLYESAERYSMVLTISGVVLLMAGWQVFWQFRWILVFLLLMVPLPGQIHDLISGPLRTFATVGAVFLLEVFGIPVVRQGNTMLLNGSIPLGVDEGCSGLRMLTAFLVVAAVLAYVVDRPRWQKVALVVSSVPVAIACNLARLWVTAILYVHVSSEAAERFFHDFAGLAMMPLAVLILAGELVLMNKLFLPEEKASSSRPARARAQQASQGRKSKGRASSGH